ncbi:MAG TPA: sulfatase, partial [Acidimicrobiia bacterium]|nr:sulfatase [Acidimicrobiia bacterium]
MHIVLICVDALRADHIGCYAGRDRGTPHLDRLAGEGVCFRNAISQSSWTAPSVTSLMTGLYPSQHDIADVPRLGPGGAAQGRALGSSVPTLAGELVAAGYATAAFVAGNAYLKPEFGIMRGFDHAGFLTTTDGAAALGAYAAWLDGPGPERSFCYLHLMEPHNPLPRELAATRPLVDRGVDLAALQTGEDTLLDYYAASVRQADARVGDVLAVLEDRDRAGDTWVIVTADHGEELNEHGAMLSHGQSLYRQLVWVPLIMRLPGGRGAGRAPAEPVSHIDLMPTILELAGVAVPTLPGRSLLPLIDGEGAGERVAYSELLKRVSYSRSITTPTHHFIERYHVSKAPPAGVADLEPGVGLEVKGHPAEGGAFLPTKISIDERASPKVLGIVDAVDPAAGLVTVMGVTCEVGPDTELVGLDKEPFTLADLAAGDRVGADFGAAGPAGERPRATRLMRRKPGGESKLEGRIETLEGGDRPCIRLWGRAIPVDPDRVRVVSRGGRTAKLSRRDVVAMVRDGRYLSKDRELYDFGADPAEAHNLVASEPALAAALEARLAGWAGGLNGV